jgi:hypothetical protein
MEVVETVSSTKLPLQPSRKKDVFDVVSGNCRIGGAFGARAL